MAESARIQELRRRVQQDPATLAFAPLAEELRRSGRTEEAIRVCQAGLAIHPEYLSARATLGRALLDAGDLEAAFLELSTVLGTAPDNLAALRGAAEIHHRRGEIEAAIGRYRLALTLTGHDTELEGVIRELEEELALTGADPAAPDAGSGASEPDERHREILRQLEQFLDAVLDDRARRAASGG